MVATPPNHGILVSNVSLFLVIDVIGIAVAFLRTSYANTVYPLTKSECLVLPTMLMR